jgi:hypothetical protein
MTQRTDRQHLYELVDQLETNLKELKQVLKYPSRMQGNKKRRGSQSLYGIFPRAKTTLADFRDARQSWSQRSKNI